MGFRFEGLGFRLYGLMFQVYGDFQELGFLVQVPILPQEILPIQHHCMMGE